MMFCYYFTVALSFDKTVAPNEGLLWWWWWWWRWWCWWWW